MKYYSGIGSRKTPKIILQQMSKIAVWLENEGFHLRSGGADGADQAFSNQISNKTIFLPWNNFNNQDGVVANSDAFESVARLNHPIYNKLSRPIKKLHQRNVAIVLGETLNEHSQFIICYTPDGKDSGGTGLAIRIGHSYNIPVYNMFYMTCDDIINDIKRGTE